VIALFVIVALLVVGAIFVAAAGRLGQFPDVEPDLRPDQGDTGFDVVARGYRMDEVDARLATLEAEIDHLKSQQS
jgi:hypothetical protein